MKVKETKSAKESLTSEINRFCQNEYMFDEDPMTAKDFCLFAVDSGGYDINGNVSFYANEDHFILGFIEKHYDAKTNKTTITRHKKFKFQVVEELELNDEEKARLTQ